MKDFKEFKDKYKKENFKLTIRTILKYLPIKLKKIFVGTYIKEAVILENSVLSFKQLPFSFRRYLKGNQKDIHSKYIIRYTFNGLPTLKSVDRYKVSYLKLGKLKYDFKTEFDGRYTKGYINYKISLITKNENIGFKLKIYIDEILSNEVTGKSLELEISKVYEILKHKVQDEIEILDKTLDKVIFESNERLKVSLKDNDTRDRVFCLSEIYSNNKRLDENLFFGNITS